LLMTPLLELFLYPTLQRLSDYFILFHKENPSFPHNCTGTIYAFGYCTTTELTVY